MTDSASASCRGGPSSRRTSAERLSASCAALTFPGNSDECEVSGFEMWSENYLTFASRRASCGKRDAPPISPDFCQSLQNNALLFNQNAEEGRNLQNSHLCIRMRWTTLL